ncbi:unnamed protein product [Staurois parvus]|uniref:Uncharacterized protein n=1 Tax=Staurois parvus TaxID=386267 RepID=A0ABN9F7H9_9NEOB|nr:unnamed protein product [Staurois parvus]
MGPCTASIAAVSIATLMPCCHFQVLLTLLVVIIFAIGCCMAAHCCCLHRPTAYGYTTLVSGPGDTAQDG